MKTAKLRLTFEELGYILEGLDGLKHIFKNDPKIEKTYNHIFNSLYKLERRLRNEH